MGSANNPKEVLIFNLIQGVEPSSDLIESLISFGVDDLEEIFGPMAYYEPYSQKPGVKTGFLEYINFQRKLIGIEIQMNRVQASVIGNESELDINDEINQDVIRNRFRYWVRIGGGKLPEI